MQIKSHLTSWDLNNKRILLRADLNVPLKNGQISNDFRLQALLKTIDYIIERNGIIILITHIGRPKAKDPQLSTKILLPWFTQRGYTIEHAETIADAHKKSSTAQPKKIILLENLRFFPGEQAQDKNFAQQLAQLGDYYVNDAFGVLHRNDSSVTLVPQQFSPEKRTVGFLIEKELSMLDSLLAKPQRPFIAIMGGGKVTDKIPLIHKLIDKIDTLLLCPAIVFTFAKALGKPVGKSLVNDNALVQCKTILQHAQKKNVSIILPVDYQIATGSIDGPLSFVSAEAIPANAFGISIGPKTAEQFAAQIATAGTLFFNGAIGFLDRKETLDGMKALFNAMAQTKGTSIITGGDSVAAAQLLNINTGINHFSTGGGASLAYLAGEQLPGLTLFISLLKDRTKAEEA